MKKLIAAGVVTAAMFGGTTTAQAAVCSVSAHEPVTTTTEHIGIGHIICAGDGTATVRAALQMFRNARWEFVGGWDDAGHGQGRGRVDRHGLGQLPLVHRVAGGHASQRQRRVPDLGQGVLGRRSRQPIRRLDGDQRAGGAALPVTVTAGRP